MPMKSLFLQAPSFDGYDGGAGARYQMKREVKSFWFPTWLAQAAAMVPGSRLIDAPPHNLSFKDIEEDVKAHELIVIHTSTPSFKSDCKTARLVREINPTAKIGFIGAKVAVEPNESMQACPELDFVARNEYDFTIKELAEGAEWSTIKGLTYRDAAGQIVSNPEREILVDMDKLPSVLPFYKQLDVKKYFGGYLLHPYMSWYTGRGCKSRCTFCLWPQTIGGHKYRFMSIDRVVQDVKYVKENFPEVKEIFFDDDTLTDNHDRVEELAKALGPLNVVWSCNAKANVPRKTLEVMKANGLRLLLVGYESGNQQILHNIKKGLLVDVAKRFSKDCHDLGIVVHGTFILGLPGETRETIQETLAFAKEVNEAVEIAHREGILTAASLMVSAPAARDAIARAKAMPNLRVASPKIAMSWESSFTAPSSWACRARPGKPFNRRWISPRKSILIRFKCRWRRLIPERFCTARRRKTAGSTTKRSIC